MERPTYPTVITICALPQRMLEFKEIPPTIQEAAKEADGEFEDVQEAPISSDISPPLFVTPRTTLTPCATPPCPPPSGLAGDLGNTNVGDKAHS